jgi:hypothetical protein
MVGKLWNNFKRRHFAIKYTSEGAVLRREEAILLLTRILTSCKPDDVTFISLDQPLSKRNLDSDDYELRFKWSVDDRAFSIIKTIVNAQGLGFREYDDGYLVIYTPKKELNNLNIVV